MIKKNIGNIIFIALLLVILLVPDAKAFLMRGMMEIGFFRPSTEQKNVASQDLAKIQFKAADGKVVNLQALQGKIVFVNIWATWCPPCIAEMPSINKVYEQYKNDSDMVFIMLDADGDFKKSQAFMDKRKYQMPLFTFYSELPKTLFDRSIPTTFVFDKKGRLSFREEGAANYNSKKFINFIEQLKALKD